MAPRNKVTVTAQPTRHRPTTRERRAAELEALSGHQAQLKREAAERRAKRAAAEAAAPPPRPAVRRSNAR
jgi:hypothetical protein